ncbi:hypothetical protein QBC42DRAFT_277421 [Cladorrhinum samala]|uniref:EngB-type G domain-containing protein n=1 Tax=Cladorrhinum samala TaxID=585594 RepID=A0AAV9HGG1_9PEZI|nr:hypothetical protein QBC42DRAFT_277421 [Cladorrhinum samala]
MTHLRLTATVTATAPALRHIVSNPPVFRSSPAVFLCAHRCLSTSAPRHRREVDIRRMRERGWGTAYKQRKSELEPSSPLPPLSPPPPPPPPPKDGETDSSSTIPTSYLPPPSNDPNQRAVPAVAPSASSLYHATHIFSSRPPKFLYSAGRFLELPRNPHTPEVCLIGRSNVGKSTLINALAGLSGSAARSSHGLQARRANSAITSRKAGCTVTLNGYGFGEPPAAIGGLKREQKQEQGEEEQQEEEEIEKEEKEREGAGGKAKTTQSGKSRADRRQEAKEARLRDPPRAHALVMVDMPGYGLGSEVAWGKEIQKYLERRVMLKGAVVLIDSVAGIKDLDRAVFKSLRAAGLKTAVVLTKVDKLIEGKDRERAQGRIQEVCLSIWNELRRIERHSETWTEGGENGWENEIFVTGAGDPKNGGLGIEEARWAICKMAGLVEDTREAVVPGLEANPAGAAPPKIVSFDDIVWAPAKPVEEKTVVQQEPEKITTFEGLRRATTPKQSGVRQKRLKATF